MERVVKKYLGKDNRNETYLQLLDLEEAITQQLETLLDQIVKREINIERQYEKSLNKIHSHDFYQLKLDQEVQTQFKQITHLPFSQIYPFLKDLYQKGVLVLQNFNYQRVMIVFVVLSIPFLLLLGLCL
jgi:hypothetical protein